MEFPLDKSISDSKKDNQSQLFNNGHRLKKHCSALIYDENAIRPGDKFLLHNSAYGFVSIKSANIYNIWHSIKYVLIASTTYILLTSVFLNHYLRESSNILADNIVNSYQTCEMKTQIICINNSKTCNLQNDSSHVRKFIEITKCGIENDELSTLVDSIIGWGFIVLTVAYIVGLQRLYIILVTDKENASTVQLMRPIDLVAPARCKCDFFSRKSKKMNRGSRNYGKPISYGELMLLADMEKMQFMHHENHLGYIHTTPRILSFFCRSFFDQTIWFERPDGKLGPIRYGEVIYIKSQQKPGVEIAWGYSFPRFMCRWGTCRCFSKKRKLNVVVSITNLEVAEFRILRCSPKKDALLSTPTNNSHDDTSVPIDISFDIITYNIWMMPNILSNFLSVSPEKYFRSTEIPRALVRNMRKQDKDILFSDVIVFTEAFCNKSRATLLKKMRKYGYYYSSPVVGLDKKLFTGILNGGVIIVSRCPFEAVETKVFGVSANDDRLAAKGIVYCKVIKEGHPFHVFATHTQAWDSSTARKARFGQMKILKQMVDEKKIPFSEPVFFVGDLNVDQWDGEDYEKMTRVLQAQNYSQHTEKQKQYSFDPETNPLASSGPSSGGLQTMLDYILVSTDHKPPLRGETYVEGNVKSLFPWLWKDQDCFSLSDHYPIFSHFEFSFGCKELNGRVSSSSKTPININNSSNYLSICSIPT